MFRQTGSIFSYALETLTIVKEPTERKEMYIPIPESTMLEAIDENYPNSMSEEMTDMFWDTDDELRAIMFGDEDTYIPYM